jgi:hypothetical protein
MKPNSFDVISKAIPRSSASDYELHILEKLLAHIQPYNDNFKPKDYTSKVFEIWALGIAIVIGYETRIYCLFNLKYNYILTT